MPLKKTKGVSSIGSSLDDATRFAEELKIANETLESQQVELASLEK